MPCRRGFTLIELLVVVAIIAVLAALCVSRDRQLHALMAAEIAMEHHLGLTCDPVEGYVQIPCIERNMTGCLRAFESASFSLLTDGRHLVSFDEVVEVMYRTGLDLQRDYLGEVYRDAGRLHAHDLLGRRVGLALDDGAGARRLRVGGNHGEDQQTDQREPVRHGRNSRPGIHTRS